MRRGFLVLVVAAAITPAGVVAADERGTAKSMISLRGASCGELVGTMTEPSTGSILAECSNGMLCGVMKARDGSGWFLTRRNSLTGKFELYR